MTRFKICLLLFLFSAFQIAIAQTTTVTYQSSNEDFANPERGFYRYSETRSPSYQNIDAATLASYRNLHQPNSDPNFQIYSTLIFRYFFLEDFKTSLISQSFLDDMEEDFEEARTAGVKIIPRIAYTDEVDGSGCSSFICPPYGDAPKNWILQHIEQLAPILAANKDVIAAMQMGFIGVWGENYYTDYFGDASQAPNFKLNDTNWQDRNEVLQNLLNAVPKDRMVQVRYPQIKQRLVYGINAPTTSAALTISEAYSESDKARLGFHNDCFLASDTDFGTYEDYGNSSTSSTSDTSNLKPYKAADSKYVVVGGETCNSDRSYDPFDDCAPTGRADTELRRFHYSYLNSQYNHPDVNIDWQNDCMEDIKRQLGYRLELQNATFSNAVRPGQRISITINIKNLGYAAPFNPRGAELVLRNTSTQEKWFTPLDSDPRFWFNTTNINQDICIPNGIALGNYKVLLHLPDLEATLYGREEYAIRLANKISGNDIWESSTGYNDLGHTLIVNSTANQPNCSTENSFSPCTAKLVVSRIEEVEYAVSDEISSTATINSGVSSTFKAGNQIVLAAPFHAKNGSTFAAIIDGTCSGNIASIAMTEIGIEATKLRHKPSSFRIHPNPSITQATLSYELKEAGTVQLQLFDAQGKLVKTIVNKTDQLAGQHQIEISSNNLVKAGVYYFVLQKGMKQEVLKWILVE